MNMKNCGRVNVRKHREIKNGEECLILDISFKFVSLEEMKITSSDPKSNLGISGKGLITYLGLKTIGSPNTNKKTMYTITNVSMKYLSNIIKDF